MKWYVIVIGMIILLIGYGTIRYSLASDFEKCVSICRWDESEWTCKNSACECLREDYTPGSFGMGWSDEANRCMLGYNEGE